MCAARFFAILMAALFAAGCATNGDLKQFRAGMEKAQADMVASLATKADKADVGRLTRRVEAVSSGIGAVNAKADDAIEAVGKLKGRADKTDATVTGLTTSLGNTNKAVASYGKALEAVNSRIAGLEKNVVGVRQLAAGAIGRIGTLEDQTGMDHEKRIFRLSGFQAASYDAEKNEIGQSCWQISAAMKKRVDEISALLKKGGWEVSEIIGFTDERPFMKNGKPLDNSDQLNAACAKFRAEAVAEALELDPSVAVGRGATTKFGGLDMNRSVLICLERRAQAPAARGQQQPQTPPASVPQQPQPSAQGGRAAGGQVQLPSGAAPAAPAAPAAGAAAQQ